MTWDNTCKHTSWSALENSSRAFLFLGPQRIGSQSINITLAHSQSHFEQAFHRPILIEDATGKRCTRVSLKRFTTHPSHSFPQIRTWEAELVLQARHNFGDVIAVKASDELLLGSLGGAGGHRTGVQTSFEIGSQFP